MRINFRNHKNAFALSVDRFGDDLLRPAVTVHLRSVIRLMPSSIPKHSAATSFARAFLLSPMRQVPCPSTGTRFPSGSATVLISIQSRLESGKAERSFSPEALTPALLIKDWELRKCLAGKSSVVADVLRGSSESRFSLARDCAQSFNQRLALCAIVDNECVVFAMR